MKPVSLAVLCFAAAIFLARISDTGLHGPGPRLAGGQASGAASDPLFLAIGSAKEAVGDTLFIRADEYFHGGVIEKNHHDDSEEDLRREGILPPEKGVAPEKGPGDWIGAVNRQVHATQDRHLAKEQRKEMLPFFKWATELDPHNVEAILTAAFWLDKEFGNPEEAKALLERGVRDNPDSWELERDLSKLYLREKDLVRARHHFREARRKSEGKEMEGFERSALDLLERMLY